MAAAAASFAAVAPLSNLANRNVELAAELDASTLDASRLRSDNARLEEELAATKRTRPDYATTIAGLVSEEMRRRQFRRGHDLRYMIKEVAALLPTIGCERLCIVIAACGQYFAGALEALEAIPHVPAELNVLCTPTATTVARIILDGQRVEQRRMLAKLQGSVYVTVSADVGHKRVGAVAAGVTNISSISH